MKNNTQAHWRDSARNVRFFILDGKAVFPLVFVLMYPRLWTLILALVATVFFTILSRYGFSISVFGRWLRSLFSGRRKMAIPWWMN